MGDVYKTLHKHEQKIDLNKKNIDIQTSMIDKFVDDQQKRIEQVTNEFIQGQNEI